MMRNLMWFLIGVLGITVVSLFAGCAELPDRSSAASTHVAYCGMARCDGKANR